MVFSVPVRDDWLGDGSWILESMGSVVVAGAEGVRGMLGIMGIGGVVVVEGWLEALCSGFV